MAELSDLITELKEGNKRTQDQLGFMANDSRNSRRHLLEMKKSIFGLAENIARMADVPPPPSEGEQTEQRREDRKFAELQLAELKKIATALSGIKLEGGTGGGGGRGRGLGLGIGAAGLGLAAFSKAALKGAAGLVAMGVAIPAFFGGLLAGDAGLSFLGEIGADFNFTALKAASLGFASIITDMPIEAMAALAGIMAIGVVGGPKAALGVGTLGAGIAAFFGGLLVGDALMGAGEKLGWLDLKFTSLATAMKGFSDVILNLSPEAQAVLGTLLLSGTVASLMSKKPTDVGTGIAAFGAGISGFFIGLAVGDKALSWLNSDFSGIAKAVKGFDDAIGNLTAKSTTALGLLLAAGGVFGAVTSEQTKKKVILGIGAISAGIAAFFIPFSAADFVAANVGDGGSIVNLVGNFSDAVGKLDEKSLTALGGLLGVGAVFGAAPGGLMIGGKVALGMGVVGAAIAAFFVAFDGMAKLGGVLGADGSSTKTLVTNMIEGIKPLQDIDGEKLLPTAKALPDIGKGIAMFFTGEMAGKLSETASDIAGFVKNIFGFGEGDVDPGKSRIQKMVDALEPLKGIEPDQMNGLNLVLDDLERLGKLEIKPGTGRNIINFANGLKNAMPDLETALYGGTVGGYGNRKTIKGLANGGQEFQLAVDALNKLNLAAKGGLDNDGNVPNNQPINYNFFDNSSPVQQQIVNDLKARNNNSVEPFAIQRGLSHAQ